MATILARYFSASNLINILQPYVITCSLLSVNCATFMPRAIIEHLTLTIVQQFLPSVVQNSGMSCSNAFNIQVFQRIMNRFKVQDILKEMATGYFQ